MSNSPPWRVCPTRTSFGSGRGGHSLTRRKDTHMNNFKQSFLWSLMSTVPLIASILMQMIVGGIVMGIHGTIITLMDAAKYGIEYADFEAYMEAFLENMMAAAGTGIFAYYVVATGLFFLWYYLMCIRPNRDMPREGKILTVPMVGWSVVIGITLCILSTYMVKFGEYIFPDTIESFYEMIERAGFGESALIFIAAVFLAPFGEEILCRGIIQHYASKISRHFWVANVVQALAFGIMHLNIVQGTYAFIIGLALGWLRVRYKTLWVPIIIHFVINFSTSTWLGYLLEELPRNLTIDFGIFALAAAATVGILVIIGKDGSAVENSNIDENKNNGNI